MDTLVAVLQVLEKAPKATLAAMSFACVSVLLFLGWISKCIPETISELFNGILGILAFGLAIFRVPLPQFKKNGFSTIAEDDVGQKISSAKENDDIAPDNASTNSSGINQNSQKPESKIIHIAEKTTQNNEKDVQIK